MLDTDSWPGRSEPLPGVVEPAGAFQGRQPFVIRHRHRCGDIYKSEQERGRVLRHSLRMTHHYRRIKALKGDHRSQGLHDTRYELIWRPEAVEPQSDHLQAHNDDLYTNICTVVYFNFHIHLFVVYFCEFLSEFHCNYCNKNEF